jgi:hypothetical protein
MEMKKDMSSTMLKNMGYVYFSNPASASNSCKIEDPITLETKCSITHGQLVDARYVLIRH